MTLFFLLLSLRIWIYHCRWIEQRLWHYSVMRFLRFIIGRRYSWGCNSMIWNWDIQIYRINWCRGERTIPCTLMTVIIWEFITIWKKSYWIMLYRHRTLRQNLSNILFMLSKEVGFFSIRIIIKHRIIIKLHNLARNRFNLLLFLL